jgi:hemerythrin-like domain-containing protein
MSHDVFETERSRVERVLEILERTADRLESGAGVPLPVLGDAVEFIRATEDAAYEAACSSEDEGPPLSACVDQHIAARAPLTAMQEAHAALRGGDATAGAAFAGAAREYVRLRREHLRLDDRLFAGAPRHVPEADTEASVESAATRRIYDRLVAAAAILDAAAAASSGTGARHTVGDEVPIEEPLSELERQLIVSYLAEAGFDYHTLVTQHDARARKLLAEAARHASERLSEIESRSRYVHRLHGDR